MLNSESMLAYLKEAYIVRRRPRMLTLEYASLFKGSIHSQAETTNVKLWSMPDYLKEAYIVRRRPRMLNSGVCQTI